MNAAQMLTNDTLGLRERGGGYEVVITEFAKGGGSKPAGTQLIRNLVQTQKVISVHEIAEGESYTRPVTAADKKLGNTDADIEVFWNPASTEEFVLTETSGKVTPTGTIAAKQPPQVHLGHEFIHSDRFAKGIGRVVQAPLSRKLLTPWGTWTTEKVGEEEWFVIGFRESEAKKQGLTGFTASKITEQMLCERAKSACPQRRFHGQVATRA